MEVSMASKLEKSVEIYRSLGYEETDFKDILNLGIGKKEEQKIAREGLKSGEWSEIKQLSENSYGFVPVVDVDLGKLAIFAIRVGVDAKRAANVLRAGSEAALKAIEARGDTYAMSFIQAACTSNRRVWEHSLSVLGMLALKLVHEMNLEIPESVEYMKDWAAAAAILLMSKRKDYNFDEDFVIEKEEILRRFKEHIEAGVALNVPATGPFSSLLIWGVQNNILDKDMAMEQVFYGLNIAQRPGDRKELVNVLEQIGLSDRDIIERTETIIPLLGLGETAILERFAPVLIESAAEDWLYTILISCSSAKVKKIKKMILNSALRRENLKSVNEYEEWLLLYKQDEDKSIVKLAGSIENKWGLKIEQEAIKEEVQGLWRETPKLWDVPKFALGKISSERLTDFASVISERKDFIEDIVFERFIAIANNIAYRNPDEAKMSLAGIPNGDAGGLRTLGRWAKNLEMNMIKDTRENVWNGEKEVLIIRYHDLMYMRRELLFNSMGKWPCLLSTPSYVDLSISLSDLVERLLMYEDKNLSYVSEPDLQLAITRLDMELLTDADIKKYTEELKKMNLKIELPSGEVLKDESGEEILVGDLIAGYLKDPYIEPEFTPGKTPYWRIELNMPKSLKVLPNRLSYSHDAMFTIFPTWGDYSLTAIHRDYEVYHGQGVILRQIARRRKPVTKGAMMNWIAIQGNLSVENADDIIKASQKAWGRGLLTPGIADISELDWSGTTPSNLASLAASMENMAKEGMLSLVWMAACDVVELSLKAPRMLAGTAEIVKFIRDYLNEVIFAVENKLATQNVLEMNAIKTLAAKSGASKAVSYAKEITNKLKSFDTEAVKEADESEKTSDVKVSLSDFDEVWVKLPESKALINDNVSMGVKALEVRKNEKVFQFNLKLPDVPEYEYQVTIAGWVYGLANEGQVSAFVANNDGKIINEDEKAVWLHYDSVKKKIILSKFRNWRDEENGPLKGEPTPYSKAFLTIAVALLAQDGESVYGAKSLFKQLVKSGELNVDTLRDITKELLCHKEISPAKLVRVVEKERELLSVFWIMLSECIVEAGKETVKNNKPPVWINRILDICNYYADYLREAAKRGYISEEDAKWQGLLEIAKSSAKSAAINKAKSLVKVLGIG
jgi:hypothetical protein